MKNKAHKDYESPYIDIEAAAKYLRISPHTLNAYRYQHKGPRYIILARKINYKIEDLDKWADTKAIEPEG